MLAIGNDGHRDWETLVRAAPSIPAEVWILTGHPRPTMLPDNVRWEPADWYRRVLSDADVREAFRSAVAVVVPVKDVPSPRASMTCRRPRAHDRSS